MIKYGVYMQKKFKHPKSNGITSYLTPLLEKAPAGWALIRANEIKALENANFNHPILDVGCGDGLVAKVLLEKRDDKFDYGIDISENEIRKARKSKAFKKCLVGSVYNLPFSDNYFQTVFSNSTIEHLKNLDAALSEISRVLKPNGQFIMTVPSPFLSKYLLGSRFFVFLKLSFLADLYSRFFHSLVKHLNIYNHKEWDKILIKHKLHILDYFYYHSPMVIGAHEVFSYLAIPQHIVRIVVGSWPMFPTLRGIIFVPWFKKLFLKFYNNDLSKKEGGSLLLIAKKLI